MRTRKLRLLLAAMGFLFASTMAIPDDIDLYTGGEQFTGAPLNVLIVLDNTSNFSATNQGWTDEATGANVAQGEVEAQVIIDVLQDLAQDSINVGIMQYADKGGGYPIFAIRPNSAGNLPVLEAVTTAIKNNVGSPAYKGPTSGDYDELINSIFRYYNSFAPQLAPTSGRSDESQQGDLRDYAGNVSPVASRASLGGHGYVAGLATFTGPADASAGCAKNFVIFIGNGYPSKSGTDAKNRLTQAGALFTPAIVPETSGVTVAETQAQVAPYWTRFMRQYGVKSTVDDLSVPGGKKFNPIHTYTIDVCNAQCDADQKALLQSMADQGRGRYFRSTDKTQLRNALATIFAEIQSVNSVFASATLPVSVNTQGTYENQVYIGVFRPDAQARPRWYGNLKEYQFARYCDVNANDRVDDIGNNTDERIDREAGNSGTIPTCTGDTLKLFLADRDNKPAIDQTLSTGFIDTAATSYWSSTSSYWGFLPTASGSVSDAPDGPHVERGGAAQKLRGQWAATPTSPHPDGRKVYTCLGSCLTPADASARALSGHSFVLSNSEVATALTAPSGSVTVTSLIRSGETVTATTATPHGFSAGNSVTLTGASKPAYDGYNGAKTLLSASGSTFTFAISESPPTTASGTVSATLAPSSVSSITLSSGLPGATVTVTVDAVTNPAAGTTQLSIASTNLPYLDGVRTGSVDGAGNFVFATTLPAAPGSATGITATGAGSTASDLTGSYDAVLNRITISNGTANLPGGLKGAPVGTTVTISNASDPLYNGQWSVLVSGNKALTFAYRTYGGCGTTPTCTGVTAAPVGAVSDTINIARTVGLTTATVTRGAADNLSSLANGDAVTITITGDAASAYNGNWTVSNANPAARSFDIGPVTLGPPSPVAGTIVATLTGVEEGPTTSNLISWMRGRDLWEDENQDTLLTDVRSSIHGDVLHSRPLLINYGGLLGVVGYYGANDGFMRAIAGGVASTDGNEKWAFIPSEFVNYQKLARLYGNSELIRYPNSSCSATPAPTTRGYFWDGQFTAYQSPTVVWYRTDPAVTTSTKPADCTSANPCYSRPEKVYMYAGMRRGGSSYYALDVSLPDAPKFLWRIKSGDAGFTNLGQTWGEPTVARIRGKQADGTTDDFQDVLIFGGGYDPTDDDKAPGSLRGNSATGKGRGVYIVNALTGALIRHVMPADSVRKYSISADIKVIDLDGDGYVDRIYAADTGGQLFRIDIDPSGQLTDEDTYTTYHLANLGDTNVNGGNDARRFQFAPDVLPFVYTRSDGASETAIMVLVGSGNREKPLPNTGVSAAPALTCPALYSDAYFGTPVIDRFYGIIDKIPAGTSTGSVSATVESELHEINADPANLVAFDMCLAFEDSCGTPAAPVTTKKGWYVTLGNGSDDEEKLVNAPRVVSGVLLFGTNTPEPPDTAAGVCSNLGRASSYAIDPFLGMPAFDRDGDGVLTGSDFAAVVVGGGLPPTVTAGVVEIDGTYHRFVIGAGGKGEVSSSPIEGAKNPISLKGTRSRVYWYYPVDEK